MIFWRMQREKSQTANHRIIRKCAIVFLVKMVFLLLGQLIALLHNHNPLASFAEILRGAIFAVRGFHHCILLFVLQCCTKRETA